LRIGFEGSVEANGATRAKALRSTAKGKTSVVVSPGEAGTLGKVARSAGFSRRPGKPGMVHE
jgi:hypothetical protein